LDLFIRILRVKANRVYQGKQLSGLFELPEIVGFIITKKSFSIKSYVLINDVSSIDRAQS